jgi:hypothetical protein
VQQKTRVLNQYSYYLDPDSGSTVAFSEISNPESEAHAAFSISIFDIFLPSFCAYIISIPSKHLWIIVKKCSFSNNSCRPPDPEERKSMRIHANPEYWKNLIFDAELLAPLSLSAITWSVPYLIYKYHLYTVLVSLHSIPYHTYYCPTCVSKT